MAQPKEDVSRNKMVQGGSVDVTTIDSLVTDFAKQDGVSPAKARAQLVSIGRPAVPSLIKALAVKDKWVRWEAAKTLSQIGDPAAAPAMAGALEDKVFGVRWLAAEGLIAMGREGLPSLLQALIDESESPWLREGAHHVLHDLAGGELSNILMPVIAAIEHPDSSVEVPLAAEVALKALREA